MKMRAIFLSAIILMCQMAFCSVKVTSGNVTINTSAMQSFSKSDMLPYRETPFKGVVPITFSSGKGPLRNSSIELYLELRDSFTGLDTYLFSSLSGATHICRSDKKMYYPVEYAEIRFTGLENQTLSEFLFYVYSISKYGIDYSLYNNGVKIADNEGGSAVEYNRPFVAKDLKIVISGFNEGDTSRAFKIDNSFNYYYYDAIPPVFENTHYIVPDGSAISLSTTSSNARIIYTTDGENPSLSNGTVFENGSIKLYDGYNVVKASTFMNGEVEADGLEHAVISKEFYVMPEKYMSDIDLAAPSNIIIINQNDKKLSDVSGELDSFSLDGYELSVPGSNFTVYFVKGATYEESVVRLEEGAELEIRNYNSSNKLKAVEFTGEGLVMLRSVTSRSNTVDNGQNLFIFNGDDVPATFTVEKASALKSIRFGGSDTPTDVPVNVVDENIVKRYFNLQGIEVKDIDRNPGIYIEVCNGKSRKVIVR